MHMVLTDYLYSFLHTVTIVLLMSGWGDGWIDD
jgi:hypothetical protein